MGSFMIRQGTGPPGDKVAFSRSSSKAKRIALSPHLGLVTVAKRQTWQTVLAIVPLLFASTAAYSESHSAATYQTPPGTKPGSSDSLPFQNLANGWQLTEQDWQNQSTNGPLWLPTGRDPYATNLSANTVVTVDWTPVANTLQDSNDIHGNTESGAGGQGPLSVGSPALQMDQDSSKNLDHAASLTVDALAKTTDTSLTLSSKGFKQPEITMTLLSLVSQAKGTGKMPLAYTMGRTATFPPILPFPDTSSSFHLDTNATLQTASASQNIASATDQPTAADTATLSSEKTLAVEHIPRIDQDFHGTWLSLTEMVYRTSVNRITAGHSSAVPSTQIDFLNGQHRKKEASSLTSISTETLIDSLQDSMTSPVGTTPGTTNIGMKLLCSSSGDVAHSSLTSRLHTSANILPGSPSQSSDASSSKTYSDQTIVHNVQELGTTKLVSRRPSAAVSATLSQSSILPSLSYPGEALTPVTLPAVITLAGFTGSRKPSRFSTHQQLEPLSTGLPLHRPIPTTAESPYASVLSTAADGAHVNPEVPLSSVFPYRRSKSTIPPIYGLSSTVALTSFSSQPSMAEYTMQGSQLSKAELPSGNVTLPVSPNLTESSALVSNSAIIQLAVETTTHVPPSSAGVPGFGLSLATTLSDLVTHTEVSLSVGLQSSQLKEQAANLDSTSLAPYLATTKEDTLTTVGMANASLAEGSSLELKEDGSLVPEEHIGPSEASTQDTISKGKSGMTYIVSSFLHWQASSSPPLSTLYSRRAETGHNVPLQTGPSEAGMLEGATTTASYRKQITELHKRTDQTPAAAKLMPIFSEPPVMASQGTTPEDLAFSLTSAEPPVEPTGAHYAWPNRSGAMSSRPPNTTSLATSRIKLMSKEPSEPETLAVSLATKMASDYIVHMFTAGNDTTLLSRPFLETAGVTLPVGEASARMAHTDLLAGGPTGRPAVEPLSTTSHEWKLAIPTPSRATASLAYITEPGRSLVTPAHDSISTGFTSIGSSRSSIPESALEINFEATQGLMGRKEQVVPTNTMLPSISSEETWTHDLKATTSQTMASTTYRTPPLAPEVDFSASAVTATLGTILGYKVTDAFTVAVPEVISTMALQSYSPRYREFSGSKAPADLSVVESKSTQAVPVSSVTTNLLTNLRTFFDKSSKSTAGAACRSASCMTSTIPASFTPSQSTLLLPTASQLLLTRKALVSPLGSTDAVKNGTTAILGTKVTSPGESGATEQMVPVTQGDHTSKQPVTKFKAPTMSQFTRSENLTFSTPVSPLLAVHHLPLQFRLTRIDYEESLENKSSQSYKKLEKEVKLTLNKMLSTYESFLQTNILNFWNGSVIVESVALFQVGGPVPTPSDIIRTVVTEVEKKEMDTFFHWRVDVKSLRSKGFSLQNLEPEKLAVSFTVLGLGSSAFFGDMINWEHLERLRNKVSLLLGARYTVQNLSLDQAGNSQGGIDLNGEIYIDTAIHVDVGWALQVLMELKNYSVDLTSLLINGSRLSLQVFPVSFLVTNRIFSERMMDRSSVEHQNLARDISNTLMHVLGKYKNLLQVAIRDITGGSLICHGDVIFQHPAPTSKDILQTLALSVGPKDYLDSSNLQVDPFSFNVAGDGLEPPSRNMGVPGYAVAIIVLCGLALIALPILALLPKMLGRREKIIINRGHDPEAGMETFELDNAGFHSTLDEIYSRRSENTEASIGVVEPSSPWDDLDWRSPSRTVPPLRQPYGYVLSQSSPWAWVDVSQPRVLSNLNPVTAQCEEAQIVVTVNRDLFGTGRLIQAADLILGSPGCRYTSLDDAANVVIFEAGLHECGSTLQMTPDSLVYRISLYYSPNPGSNTLIIRTSPAEVPIECHYPRKDNVSSKAIKPTWVPFSSTISAENRLAFSLRLMNDDWSAERTTNRYQLGDAMHIQADVNTENHVALRLFISTCVATVSPDRDSSPRYALIDFNGCLVDGRSEDSSSAFVSPRLREDSLQFTVDAFRFTGDLRDLVYITCHLKVTAADQPLGPLNKACSFNKARNSWSPVEGVVDICSCCETRNCDSPGGQSGRINPWWRGSGQRFQRDAAVLMHGDSSSVGRAEADVVIGPVVLDAQKTSVHLPENQRTSGLMTKGTHEMSVLTVMGLTIAAVFLSLASVILGFLFACKKRSHSNTILMTELS